jgi:hypothetical protein
VPDSAQDDDARYAEAHRERYAKHVRRARHVVPLEITAEPAAFSVPHAAGGIDHQFQLGPLLVLGEQVAL